MELSARPAITAGVALATAGMIAATPVASVVPALEIPDIQLASWGGSLETWLTEYSTDQMADFATGSAQLLSIELQTEALLHQLLTNVGLDVGKPDSILQGSVNRGFNVINMLLDGFAQGVNGVVGARVDEPAAVTTDLLLGPGSHNIFNSGDVGGLLGAFNQGLKFVNDITGLPPESLLTQIEGVEKWFNAGLVDAFKGFNGLLVKGELGFEELISPLFKLVAPLFSDEAIIYKASDSILNGVINRGFNTFNMFVDAGQQGLLGVLGANGFDPQSLTETLLLGVNASDSGLFNSGDIGGLFGVLGQGYMTLADMGGIIEGLFDGFGASDFLSGFDSLVPVEFGSGIFDMLNPMNLLGLILGAIGLG